MTKIYKVANGVTILATKQESRKIMDIRISFDSGGAYCEPSGKMGVAHFLEHMSFNGTINRSREQIQKDASIIGANFNAFTSQNRVSYEISGLVDYVEPMFDLLFDVSVNQTVPESEIERERAVIQQERITYSQDPHEIAYYAMNGMVYSGLHHSDIPIIGTEESINAITRDDMLEFHTSRYCGKNCVVNICGNFTEEQILMIIEKVSHIPSGNKIRTSGGFNVFDTSVSRRTKRINNHNDSILVDMAIPYELNETLHMSYVVAVEIIGGYKLDSMLMDALRTEKGLVYGTSMDLPIIPETTNSYYMTAYFETQLDQTVDALTELIKVIRSSASKLTEDHMNAAILAIKTDIAKRYDSFKSIHSIASSSYFYDEDHRSFDRIIKQLDNLSFVDIENAMLSIAANMNSRSSTVVVGNNAETLDLVGVFD